jgi:hypothetical protein
MKFDVVIGNPPYKHGLHLKFLEKAIEISNNIVAFIEPIYFLINEKPTKRKHIEKRLIDYLKDNLSYLKIFNGNYVFNAEFFTSIGIIILNKNIKNQIQIENDLLKENYILDDLSNLTKFGNSQHYKSLKNKILKYEDNFLNHKNKICGSFFVNLGMMNGGKIGCPLTRSEKVSKNIYKSIYFSFKTETEAENCLSYLKTNFARFALMIYQNHQNIDTGELASVPYLDFTQEWTDEKLHDNFNLTQDEVDFIKKHIPEYYDRKLKI